MIIVILEVLFSLRLIRIILVLVVAFSYSSVVNEPMVLSSRNFMVSGNILENISNIVCISIIGRLILIPGESGNSTDGGELVVDLVDCLDL